MRDPDCQWASRKRACTRGSAWDWASAFVNIVRRVEVFARTVEASCVQMTLKTGAAEMQEVDRDTQHYGNATDDACRQTVAIQKSSPAAGPSAMIAAGRLSRGRVTAARRDENGSARAAEVVRRCDAGAARAMR